MRVKRILTDAETDAICRAHGVEPMERQGGPIGLEKLGLKAGDTVADDGTSAGGQNVRFSMEGPVEETKELLAVHNLTEQNLEWALEMGGLPMPSIAVIKADQVAASVVHGERRGTLLGVQLGQQLHVQAVHGGRDIIQSVDALRDAGGKQPLPVRGAQAAGHGVHHAAGTLRDGIFRASHTGGLLSSILGFYGLLP